MATREQLKAALVRADRAGDQRGVEVVLRRLREVSYQTPSGRVITALPKDADEATAFRHITENYAPQEQAALLTPPDAGPPAEGLGPLRLPGAAGEFAVGMGRGFTDFGEGVQQASLQAREALGAVPGGTTEAYTEERQEERDLYAGTPAARSGVARVGRFAGNVAPTLAIPGVGGGLVSRIATEGIIGAGQGALEFVPEGGNRLANAGLGAATGAGVTGLIGGGARAVNRLMRGPEGAAAEVIEAGARHDVPVYAPDLPDAGPSRRFATGAENLPLGMTGPRVAQREAASEAAERVVGDARGLLDEAQDAGLERIRQVADAPGPRQQEARRVLEQVEGAEGDWPRIIQASGNTRLLRAKLASDRLYDRVATLTRDAPGVRPDQTIEATTRALEELGQSSLPANRATVNLLEGLRENLGRPHTFDQLRATRSETLNAIRDAQRGLGQQAGTSATRALEAVESAIERDLERAAGEAGGEAMRAFRRASRFYRNSVVPLRDREVRRIMESETPDQIYRQFIRAGQGDRARKFYRAMGERGRQAVRTGMLEEAMDKATSGGTREFSPAKFAGELDRLAKPVGVFFRGAAKKELDGFTRLMSAVRRAGQIAEDPSTGWRGWSIALPAAAVGLGALVPADPTERAITGAGTAVGLGLLSRALFGTAGGRSALRAISTAPKAQLNGRIDDAISMAARASAEGATGER